MSHQVLALNEHGTPLAWVSWQDVAYYKCKDLIVWEMGNHTWTHYGGINRNTGNRTSVTYSSIIAVRSTHFPKRLIPPLTNENLFGRDLMMCAYCGKTLEKRALTKDHIIPRARGGKNTWTNCVTACKSCNNYKGHKLLEEINMKLLYVPYTPCREEVLILNNRKILADQMSFLKNSLPDYSRIRNLH